MKKLFLLAVCVIGMTGLTMAQTHRPAPHHKHHSKKHHKHHKPAHHNHKQAHH